MKMRVNKIIPAIVMIIAGFLTASCKQQEITPESLGWKLAYQSFTFKNFTFEEGLQKGSTLGLKYVEAYRKQKISSSNPNTSSFDADSASRAEMKRLMADYQIEMINYGVVKASDEAEWERIFEFAKGMGVQTLTAEPEPQHLNFIEKLCEDYKINLAIHNHPVPSSFWTPDSVLKYVEGRSQRIGACADIGHWVRSGLDPLNCLRMLEGRIISIHFKDLNEKDRQAHDVIWGTGVCDLPALLQELKNQGFRGVFTIEYEYNWDDNVPEIAESMKNFREITAGLN
jgi:sugar phosphate isomerase/epimerase